MNDLEIGKLPQLLEKTDVVIAFEDAERGFVEEKITVFHKPLWDVLTLQEIYAMEQDGITEPPPITRQLLFIGAQSPNTKKDGVWQKWTAETLKEFGLPFQRTIKRQVINPVFQSLAAFGPTAAEEKQREPETEEAVIDGAAHSEEPEGLLDIPEA
jgi:hypothetical protein